VVARSAVQVVARHVDAGAGALHERLRATAARPFDACGACFAYRAAATAMVRAGSDVDALPIALESAGGACAGAVGALLSERADRVTSAAVQLARHGVRAGAGADFLPGRTRAHAGLAPRPIGTLEAAGAAVGRIAQQVDTAGSALRELRGARDDALPICA